MIHAEITRLASKFMAGNIKLIELNSQQQNLTSSPDNRARSPLPAIETSYHKRSRSESPRRTSPVKSIIEESASKEDLGNVSPNTLQSGKGSSIWIFDGLLKSFSSNIQHNDAASKDSRELKDAEFRTRFTLPETEKIEAGKLDEGNIFI